MESQLIISLCGDDRTTPLKKRAKLWHLRSCTRTTKELPDEIMNEEILVRLPVETLLRVRSVCKSWESLFFTPDFVQAHFKNTLNKSSIFQDCLVARKCEGFMLLSRYKETRIEPPRPKIGTVRNSRLVGSINGLVCLVYQKEFFLWNPIIGRYREFTTPPEFSKYSTNVGYTDRYKYLIGFGWDCVENDYQVVVCYLFAHSRLGVVYSSNSNSWTKLVVPDFVFPSHMYEECSSGMEYMTASTIVKECPYWCYSVFLPKMRRKYTALVKFDIRTQKFRSLPEIDYALVRGNNYDFVNVKDSLAIMVYKSKFPNASMELYILHEESGVWNKIFTIGSPQSKLNIWSVLQRSLQGFKFGGEIVLQSEGKVFCYDPDSDEVKGFVGSSNHCHVLQCFSYTASLVFLRGMKRVQSRTSEKSWFNIKVKK